MEIKFRGLTSEGHWHYGYYVLGDGTLRNKGYILAHGVNGIRIAVDPPTVGQFVGLLGKHKREIYEGDIYHQGDPNIRYVVVFHKGQFIGKQVGSSSYAGLSHFLSDIEVIGTIHDSFEAEAARRGENRGEEG